MEMKEEGGGINLQPQEQTSSKRSYCSCKLMLGIDYLIMHLITVIMYHLKNN